MPEDYGFDISPSGDARHIYKKGALRPGFSSLKVTWIPKVTKCQGPAMMIQWPDKAGNLRMKHLLEGLPRWQRNRMLAWRLYKTEHFHASGMFFCGESCNFRAFNRTSLPSYSIGGLSLPEPANLSVFRER
jgi:hypothetical protein